MPKKTRKDEPAIVKIMWDAWEEQPSFKAAKALRKEGVTAQLFWEFFYRDGGADKHKLSSAWVNNTYNELRDLEREDKQKATALVAKAPRGRPPVDDAVKQRARSLIQANPTLTMSAVARHVGVSGLTVSKWFREWNLKRWSDR